jgi:poly(3-hydroxybutyrate) depolymerase
VARVQWQSEVFKTAFARGQPQGPPSPASVAKLVGAAATNGLSSAELSDFRRLLTGGGATQLPPESAQALRGLLESVGALPNTLGFIAGRTRRPEAPAKPGDVVAGPAIPVNASTVRARERTLRALFAKAPTDRAAMAATPFPSSTKGRLDWAIAQEPTGDKFTDPLWNVGTNDSSAAWAAYVQGVVEADAQGFALDDHIDEQVEAARAMALQSLLTAKDFEDAPRKPFPTIFSEQLKWAAALNIAAWDPDRLPSVTANPGARALVHLVRGVLAKAAQVEDATPVVSERKTFKVDTDTRVYAVHTPAGPRPKGGWPTVVFFHGSYGGYAPEQTGEYQALNAIADRRGYQVLYLVGLPQDRSDAHTGRGMLNWDPVGAGPGGANDRFVFQLLRKLVRDGDVDKTRTFITGHSQGGFYVSDLIAAHPAAFAGAAIFGAGAGSVAQQKSYATLSRSTPLLLHVGANDIHTESGLALAARLQQEGYRDFSYEHPAGRGHEIIPADYEHMFDLFQSIPPFEDSQLGILDGKTDGNPGTGPGLPSKTPFRPVLDLRDLPPEVSADPQAVLTLRSLAANPYLQLDGDTNTLSVEEWKLALYYLHTFSPQMQSAITALRNYFVTSPPPTQNVVDLSRAGVWTGLGPAGQAAAQFIAMNFALDLDGYPGIISEAELAAAEQNAAQLPPTVQQGLTVLRAALACAQYQLRVSR